MPPLSESSQTFSGKPLLCSQTAGCTFSAKEKEEFEARIKYYVTTLGNMIIIMIHLDVVDYDPCQKCHIVLTNLKHTSNISPHFQNIFFSEDLIWFDFWLLYCPMYYSGISIGPGSCLVLHCHSHNYSKTDFVVKSNQNWSLSNGWQNHYFSWWLYVTTLSHNSFCICCQREQTLMIERIKYEIWVWFGHHFF